jgi:hypothetical protein
LLTDFETNSDDGETTDGGELVYHRRVRFADEIAGAPLEEIFEVEEWEELSRFCTQDFADAERAWHNELQAQLEDKNTRSTAFGRLDGVIAQLALNSHGCEVVHQALDVADSFAQQQLIARNLWWNVRALVLSPHGVDFLQQCIEILSPDLLGFIVAELGGIASAVARMEEGHKVICNIIECLPCPITAPLVAELSHDVVELSCDAYGSSVIHQLLDHEASKRQHSVWEKLAAHASMLAIDRRARRVFNKALTCSPPTCHAKFLDAVQCAEASGVN